MINKRMSAIALTSVLLMACSPDEQDEGNAKKSAVLLDSTLGGGAKIVQGVVYADLNENGKLDLFEPYATTGADGKTRVDADCFSDSVPAECLLLTTPADSVLVRVLGGFLSTEGVPFVGQYSARVGSGAMQSSADVVAASRKMASAAAIDALTTLQAALSDEQVAELNQLLTDGDLMRIDAALSALVRQIVDSLDDAGDNEKDQLGLLIDAVVAGLAEYLLSPGASLSALISDPEQMRNILSVAYSEVFPSKQLSDTEQQAIADLARLVLEAVDHFAADNASLGARRALQVLLVKLGATLADADADYFDTEEGVAFITALGSGEFDLEALAAVSLSGPGDELAESVSIPEGSPNFAAIGGQYLEFAADGGDDPFVKAQLYFAEGTTQGDVSLCLLYQSSEVDDPLNTEGSLIRGDWLAVDAHTLVLGLQLLGSRYSVSIRGVGVDTYRFDFGGEFAEYTGPAPFEQAGTTPTTSAECAAQL